MRKSKSHENNKKIHSYILLLKYNELLIMVTGRKFKFLSKTRKKDEKEEKRKRKKKAIKKA